MMKRTVIHAVILSLIGLSAMAQQNVTIQPGDDVVGIIQTVVDVGSTVTFEAGYYKVTPKEDGTGRPDLMRLPPATTVRGAGSGMDPSKATIIDCGYAFDSVIKIDDNVDGCTFENMTLLNVIDAVIEFDAGSFDNTFNNVWALKAMGNTIDMNDSSEAVFNFCVFGWASGDAVNLAGTSYGVFTNCDMFLGSSDIIETADTSEAKLMNCIIFAGPGANDIETTGFMSIIHCVGWDPIDGDPAGISGALMGRLDVNGGNAWIDEYSVGEDPLYIAPPGMGFTAATMDLHLQEGSPALTAGNTSFDEDDFPTGDPTFAGSQGPAPVNVSSWSLY